MLQVKKSSLRLKDPVFWGVVLSIAIMLLVAYLAQMPVCVSSNNCLSRFSIFMASPANEMGDALAGISGTLALIWIIVTLVIQRMEISAAREQGEANSAALLAQKTYFEEETMRQKIKALEDVIAAMLPNFDFQPSVVKLKGSQKIELGFVGKSVTENQFRAASSCDRLHMAAAVGKGVTKKIKLAIQNDLITEPAAGRAWYEAIFHNIKHLQRLADHAPEDQKALLDRSRLDVHREYLEYILDQDVLWRDKGRL